MMYRATRFACLLFVLAVATLSAACTSTGQSDPDEEPPVLSDALVKATVEYAVLRAVGDDPARAEQVATLADHALSLAQSGDQTTTLALDIAVRDRISRLDLSREERVLVNTLAAVVRSEIRARIKGRDLDAERMVVVIDALTWVRDMARMVAPRERAAPVEPVSG